jgi:peptide/nickel transport system substrate-binding protein
MTRVKKIAVMVGLMALLGATTVAVMPVRAQTPQEDEKLVWRIGTENEIDSLNPFKALELPSFELFGLQYNLLVEFSQEDYGPTPGLAESWEHSEDGLTWTYHLNPDATWHDGEPITSEDVKYTFERILEEEQALFIDYLRQIDTIETPDEQTVVIHTKRPSVQMLSMWVPILPKHIWEDVPADETKSFENEPSIGSGPFQAVEWRKGQFLRLEANEDYFKGAPTVDEIVWNFYDNPDTMVQALKRGEVDYIDNPPISLFKQLETEPGIETVSSAAPGFTELAFNVYEPNPEVIKEFAAPKTSTGHPALLDARVRQAINWAIDEQELTDKILRGEGQPGSTLVPPPLAQYHLDLDDSELMTFDIDRARELLAEAGWEDTNDNGTVDKGGTELELRLIVRSESPDGAKLGQFVEDWLGQAGIEVATKAMSDNALTDVIYEADFDMFIWGWGSDPDPDFILSVLTCDQIMGWSDSFWCNEEYSDLYQEQKTLLDIDERAEAIQRMQEIAYEESPYVIFFYDNWLEAYRTDRLTGWTRQPEGTGAVFYSIGPQYTAMNLKPLSAEQAAEEAGGGGSAVVWILVAVVIIVAVGAGVAFARRGSREERA